jgi:hypothetical protein
MYLCDWVDEIESKIMEFHPTIQGKNKCVLPKFKNKDQHRVFDYLDGAALGIYKIRFYEQR